MAKSTLNIGQELHSDNLIYRIETVLGQGSFGITYKAKAFTVIKGKFGEELVETNTPKAIKEFFMKEVNERDESGSITGMSEGGLSYNYAQKFKKEAENLASMNHPNIVKVIDFISANNTYYYVMDFIEGENLNDYLKHQKMTEQEATDAILEVAKALKYMHEKKHMLHLDLKPGNIMRRESDGHIFLIDFGLSKHYSEEGVPETSTSVGLGTPGYAPVEQANSKNAKKFRETLDVYALGATFYKLLTGQTPPSADELVSDGDVVKDELAKLGINGVLTSVVVNAMKPSVKERIQNVAEFLGAFNPKDNQSDVIVVCTDNDATTIDVQEKVKEPSKKKASTKTKIERCLKMFYILIVLCLFFLWYNDKSGSDDVITYYNDLSSIQIGDYLYADGTYTHKLDSANLTNCSGCVYNLTTTESEKEEGWTHGHIVALKDAVDRNGNTKFEWGPENSEIPNCQNHSEAIKAKDGYWYCLMDSACQSPAISSIDDFDGNIFDVPLPDKCKWYVPTPSDWKDILVNLGKATVTEESESLLCYDGKTVSSTLHKKIGGFKKNKGQPNDDYSYWTCIQQGKEWTPDGILPRAWAIYANGEFGNIGNSPTRNKMGVRPVSAF